MKQSATRSTEAKAALSSLVGSSFWEDEHLTIEAKGVLGYMLSRPGNWNIRLAQLEEALKVGKQKLRRVFRELVAAGYVARERQRREGMRRFYVLTASGRDG